MSEQHRQDRRDHIAQAAMTVIARKGFQAASIADIIAESGISAGSIYDHFKNKSEIARYVATTSLDERLAELWESIRVDPAATPAQLARRLFGSIVPNREAAEVVVHIWSESLTDPDMQSVSTQIITRMIDGFRSFLVGWYQDNGLDRAASESAAADLAPVVVGVCQGYILQSALVPTFDGTRYLAQLDALFQH